MHRGLSEPRASASGLTYFCKYLENACPPRHTTTSPSLGTSAPDPVETGLICCPIAGMSIQIGDTIGDYQIVDVLGKGGMGKLFRVRNLISDRVDALKIIAPDLVRDPELADRFLREIKVHASLE